MQYRVFRKFNIVYGEGLLTPVGRLAWPNLVTKKDPLPPKEGEKPGTPKYEVTLMLDKKNKEVIKFVSQLEKIASEMVPYYNENAQNEIAKVKRILRDGDKSDLDKYPGDAGHWLLVARNKDLPKLHDSDGDGTEAPDFFKGGMKVRFVVEPSLSSGGLGFKACNVQLVEDDGVRFGGTPQDYSSLVDAINKEEDGAEDSEEKEEIDEDETEKSSDDEDAEDEVEEEPKKAAKAPALSPRERAKQEAELRAKGNKGKTLVAKGKAAGVALLKS